MKSNFRTALYPLLIIGITLSACIYYWLNLNLGQQVVLEAARHRGELHVQQISEAVDQQLDANLRSVDTALRHLRTVYLHSRKDFDRSVKDVLEAYPKGMLQFLVVMKEDGSLAYSSDGQSESKKLNFSDREHFRIHADSDQDRLFISKPIIGRIALIPLVMMTRTIREGKHFVGVIGIPLRPDYISNNLWSLHIDTHDLISIVREDGRIIARSRKLEEGLKLTTPADRPFMGSHSGEHGVFRDISITDKVPLLFSWRHLTNYPLIAVAAIDESRELKDISGQQSIERVHTLQAMTLVLIFALCISLLLIKVKKKNQELAQSQETLQKSETRLRIMLNNEMVGIVTVKDRVVQWANSAFEKMLGYQESELNGAPTRQNFLNEAAYQAFGDAAYPLLRSGKIYRTEIEHRLKNGDCRWVDVSGALLNPQTGESLWTFIDITERKKAEEALKDAARYARSLLEASLDPLVMISIDGRITDVNIATENVTGVARAELIGTQFENYFTTPEKARESYQRVFLHGLVKDYPLAIRHVSGKVTEVLYNASLYRDKEGKALGVFAAARDITERNQAEMKLAESETRLRTIIDNEPECIKIVDAAGHLTQMNPAGLKMIEADSFEQVAGCIVMDVIATEYRSAFLEMHQRVIAGEAVQMEFEVQGLKGGRRWLETHAVPLLDQGETVQLAVTRDISERKRLQAGRDEALNRLQKIARQVPGVVYQYLLRPDGSSCFPFASEGIQKIYRVTPEEVRVDASRVFTQIHPDDYEGLMASIRDSARDLTPWHHEYRVKFEDGAVDWLFGNAMPQREVDGSVLWHGFITHINERKLYEEELKRSNAELEQFSYAVSHDMRQPLRMISSYLQLLEIKLAEQLDGEKREFFNYAIDGARRIDQMLVALLDYSRVGRKCNPPDWIDSRSVLDEALLFLTPAIAEAQAELTINGLWPRIMVSRDEITRLMQNLIGNAVKYRVAGRIPRISISSETVNHTWQLSIADNGVGIHPSQINRLFKVFQRLQTREAYEGTGIGLALCLKIAEHHKGRIWAESAGDGLGSKFRVELPVLRVGDN